MYINLSFKPTQEMSPRHGLTNIDIVPLEHYGSMMETSIDVVANYNVVTSDEPYGPTSQKPLINPNSPDRGPPKRGGPAPMGARQVRISRILWALLHALLNVLHNVLFYIYTVYGLHRNRNSSNWCHNGRLH